MRFDWANIYVAEIETNHRNGKHERNAKYLLCGEISPIKKKTELNRNLVELVKQTTMMKFSRDLQQPLPDNLIALFILIILNCFLAQLTEHPRNKTEKSDPGDGVEAYTLALAQDESSIFAKNIYNFIACTKESREKIPHKVMRNMRQFMNGMKNYLVKHGEKDFGIEVDKARAALKHDEFLNLDQILEGVMHQLVVLPLKDYLYELFVDFYGSRGDIELIISNMKFAENKDPTAFGVKVSIIVEKGEGG